METSESGAFLHEYNKDKEEIFLLLIVLSIEGLLKINYRQGLTYFYHHFTI